MTGENATPIIHDGEPDIKVGIVAKHILHYLIMELIIVEHRGIWFKINISAVLVLCRLSHIALQLTILKDGLTHFALTIAVYLEMCTQCIHSLYSYTIQANGLLESLRVEFSAGVQNTHRVDKLTLRDASTVVSNRDAVIVFDIHLDTVASLHLELIDGVVEHFLQQDIDSIFCRRAVTQTSDIHTWTQADMLQTR